ncbi:MAG: AmmeMemoRadiSam system protein B [Acidobacteria bacterium]|nr:AmmeMemoRadiSam system protein B [Acidobacteriota bacterium]
MSKPLPRLRMDLDFMPSPLEDQPGLLIRDPFQYSDITLVVPPPLVPLLGMLDGEQTEDEMRRVILEMTQDVRAGAIQDQLLRALDQAGFVEGESFDQLRAARHEAFAREEVREAAHAGGAYPDDAQELSAWLAHQRVKGSEEGQDGLIGIAAPHVSPEGGWDSYRQAYSALNGTMDDRVFIVLGTSHYGEPETFGLTRKSFRTPFGLSGTDTAIVDWLERKAPRAVRMEDYCHAVEHSIEFQVVFLQSLFGPAVKVVPILCGPFARSLYLGGKPEDDEGVGAFLDALGELNAREGRRLCWILGVDMAHIGRRYGDPSPAQAHQGLMLEVAERDRQRMACLSSGDPGAFWDLVQPNHDDLKWCGSSPLYSFLKAVPQARGEIRHYEQWNIDEHSVVSFGALAFR